MKIISIGCSFTAGLGVLQEESYTSQLSKYIKCSNNNWGAAGHSNQYIFRKTIEILEKWNNDDILIIQWTNPNRDEIITNEGYLFYITHPRSPTNVPETPSRFLGQILGAQHQ